MPSKPSIGIIVLIFSKVYLTIGHKLLPTSLLASTPPNEHVLEDYNHARNVRIKRGHYAASTLYQRLLTDYRDVTAATRIAASLSSPERHDQSCPLPNEESEDDDIMNAISRMRSILEQSDYNNQCIQEIFGIKPLEMPIESSRVLTKAESLAFAKGPVYVKPVSARAQSQLPLFLQDLNVENESDSSLKCLVALFLLGFAGEFLIAVWLGMDYSCFIYFLSLDFELTIQTVPREMLSQHLIGGFETIQVMEQLGLAFPCEIDPSMIVPYVHIFPLQIEVLDEGGCANRATTKPLILVTDCHPTILSRTTVGTKEDGAVMYIGPDSLALVQHTPIQSHLMQVLKKRRSGSSRHTRRDHFQILDFCTGSGVQALSTLISLERVDPRATALCMDINARALRFTKFNSFLNGLGGKRVHAIKADLISGKMLDPADEISCEKIRGQDGEMSHDILDILLKNSTETQSQIPRGPFDVILSNPPFIPTPKAQGDDLAEVISKRYGLFSSGGSSGEEVLQSIVSLSSRLLLKDDGILAIVSEFMNPPTTSNPTESETIKNTELLHKICEWWKGSILDCDENVSVSRGKGLLFTNLMPVSASTYASRRADDGTEYLSWMRNLEAHTIHCVSPGLLYIKTDNSTSMNAVQRSSDEDRMLDLDFRLVPRDELGSVWTPFNYNAVFYTAREWNNY